MCDASHNLTTLNEHNMLDAPPCVYVKPIITQAKHGSDIGRRGDTINGSWCSTWCCCQPGYHGTNCDDLDECAASPCRNGGTCTESWTDPRVNNYLEGGRFFRCECAQGFSGHACDAKEVIATGTQATIKCKLSRGPSGVVGATMGQRAYEQFRVVLSYLGVTITTNADYERFCGDVYALHGQGGLCGQRLTMWSRGRGAPIVSPRVNCHGHFESFVTLKLCAAPCIDDTASQCCFMLPAFATWFPCCRTLGCCPDQLLAQLNGKTRRKMQGVAVSVAVDVQSGTSSSQVFKSLMHCLNTSKSEAHCYKVDSHGAQSVHRLLAEEGRHNGMCVNGGIQVTCNDGVWNRDEVSNDCGGSCNVGRGTACSTGFKRLARHLHDGTHGTIGAVVSKDIRAVDFSVNVMNRSTCMHLQTSVSQQNIASCSKFKTGCKRAYLTRASNAVRCNRTTPTIKPPTSITVAQYQTVTFVCNATLNSQENACIDTPGFSDRWGSTCADYLDNGWCTKTGAVGTGWQASWGALGHATTTSCCACGKALHNCAMPVQIVVRGRLAITRVASMLGHTKINPP